LQELVRKFSEYQSAAFTEDLQMVQAEADLRAMDHSSSEQDQALNAKQAEVHETELAQARRVAQAKELKKQVEESLQAASDEIKDAVGELREGNPDATVDEVRQRQEEAEAKLNCTVDVSHVVLEQYDKRAAEVS